VKVAAVVVTATVAAGVGYKGVQAVGHGPTKSPAADVEKTPKTGVPTGAVAPRGTQAADVKKPKVEAKRHGKPVTSPGRAKHGASPQPGLATSESAKVSGQDNSAHAAASGAAGNPKPHPTGAAKPKPHPKPPASGGKDEATPKGGKGPQAGGPATPKTPAAGGAAGTGDSSGGDSGATNGGPSTGNASGGSPAGQGQSGATSPAAGGTTPNTAGAEPSGTPTQAQQPPAPPSTPPTTTTPPPAEQTPPGDSGDSPSGSSDGHSNNGWDNGKKLGFYNENQDGKHLVTP
jgi:hypothetical protein